MVPGAINHTIFHTLQSFTMAGNIVSTSSCLWPADEIERDGVITNHAYSLLAARTIRGVR